MADSSASPTMQNAMPVISQGPTGTGSLNLLGFLPELGQERRLHTAGPGDLANIPLQQLRHEAQALMADIGASATMQNAMPVMIQGPNGQQQLHYITLGGLPGVSQQQQLPAWPVMPLPQHAIAAVRSSRLHHR